MNNSFGVQNAPVYILSVETEHLPIYMAIKISELQELRVKMLHAVFKLLKDEQLMENKLVSGLALQYYRSNHDCSRAVKLVIPYRMGKCALKRAICQKV